MNDYGKKRAKRNLNPHAEARLAMLLWGAEYARRGSGSMDFWDYIGSDRKLLCTEQVKLIKETKSEEPSLSTDSKDGSK